MKLSDIKDPDTLTDDIEHDGIKLTVGSIECTAYNDYVRSTWLRNSMREDKPSDEELAHIDRKGAALLVRAWSLEDDCTHENIMELLRRKRILVNKIYMAASGLGKPLTEESKNSGGGAKDDSGSGKKPAKKAS